MKIHFKFKLKITIGNAAPFGIYIFFFFFFTSFDLIFDLICCKVLPLTSATQSYLQCHNESSKLLPPSRHCLYYGDRRGIPCTAMRQRSPESPALSAHWSLNWCGNQEHQGNWSLNGKMIALDLPRKGRFFLHFV